MNSNDFRPGWYVLYVKTRHEKKIKNQLVKIGIKVFLPCKTTMRQWSDRKKKLKVPLFPTYVFVYIKSYRQLHEPLMILGVYYYLKIGSRYALIKEKEIDSIRLLVGLATVQEIDTTHDLPKIGEMKKISRGPLGGLDCYVIRAEKHDRIYVRIKSLHKNITAILPNHLLVE